MVFSFGLSACGSSAPEDILTQTKQAILSTESGHIDITANLKARGGDSSMDVLTDVMLDFARQDAGGARLFDWTIDISGLIEGAERDLDLDLNVNWIAGGPQNYVKINDFASNDDTLQLYLPLVNLYKGKWVYLSEAFLPPELAFLPTSGEDEVKRQQRDDLFVSSSLFTITKDNGSKKVDGVEVYHLELEPNRDGLMEYYRGIAAVNETSVSDADLQELVVSLESIESLDIYVGVDDFRVYKAELKFLNALEDEEKTTFEIVLTLESSQYNEDIVVEVPVNAEEFNPFAAPAALSPALEEAPVVEEALDEVVPVELTDDESVVEPSN